MSSVLVEECLDGLSSTVMLNWDYKDSRCRQYLDQLISDESLSEFASCLSVDPVELESQAKPRLAELLNAIVSHGGCPVDRFCVSGSVGHQTDSDKFGFDITVFVDCDVSHRNEGIAACCAHSDERIYSAIRPLMKSDPVKDQNVLHFCLGAFMIHLAVTPSFGHKMHLQRKHVWDLLEARDKEGAMTSMELKNYSLALHESLASFMHMGDPLFHGLVRLARLWREHMCQSSISALVATLLMMRCIEDEKARGMTSPRSGSPSASSAHFPTHHVFVAFLTCLTNIDTIRMSWQRFYEPDLVPERHVASTGACLLDPVNPYRNLLADLTPDQIETVKGTATKSLEQLKHADQCTVYQLCMGTTTGARGG